MSIFQGVAKNCLFGTAEPELPHESRTAGRETQTQPE